MISERKRYIIILFLKRCTLPNIPKTHIDFLFELYKNTYSISDDMMQDLRSKYNIDKYIERLIPLVDKQFTIEELQDAIQFFSSGVGKKMIDMSFLQEIGKMGTKLFAEIEQEFAISSSK